MQVLALITSNYVLNAAVLSWLSAQVIKTVLHAIKYRTFNPERLFGAGGMPSAHSATVCGMTLALARSVGFSSPIFAVAAVLAMITMYDAMGVRRQYRYAREDVKRSAYQRSGGKTRFEQHRQGFEAEKESL